MKFTLARGRAKNKGKDGYSQLPESSGSNLGESHQRDGSAVELEATPASGAQPASPNQSRSERLQNAEILRTEAQRKGEEGTKWLSRAQDALALGNLRLAKKFKKFAKTCWKAMKKLNRMAAGIIFRVMNKNAKSGQVDLHFLHVDEAIERAEERLQMSMSRGERTISFITGKGKRSNDGPKILPALQEHIAKRGLESELDPTNGGVLVVHLLPRQET